MSRLNFSFSLHIPHTDNLLRSTVKNKLEQALGEPLPYELDEVSPRKYDGTIYTLSKDVPATELAGLEKLVREKLKTVGLERYCEFGRSI